LGDKWLGDGESEIKKEGLSLVILPVSLPDFLISDLKTLSLFFINGLEKT
jgi:hypothetical protein